MSLEVDQLELGPIGTNTYLVRASSSATEAVVVDPSGDAATIQAALAARAAALRSDPRHPRPLRPHRQPRRPGRADRRSRLRPGRGADPDRGACRVHAAGDHGPRLGSRTSGSTAGRRSRSPASPSPSPSCPGHSPAHLAFFADGHLFSGDVLFAGSVGRTDLPGGDWEVLQASIASFLDAYPPDTIVHPGHGPRDDSCRRARPATRFSPTSARRGHRGERQDRASARDARRRPRRDAALAARHGRGRAALRALRLPQGAHARVRGHRPLRTHVRAGLGRGAEGDVQLHRPLRPAADAAPGGHRADLPRVRRARDAARSAAREDVHDRADVPLRQAGQGPLSRALAGIGRGDRLGRPVDRRGADPALRHAAPPARA